MDQVAPDVQALADELYRLSGGAFSYPIIIQFIMDTKEDSNDNPK